MRVAKSPSIRSSVLAGLMSISLLGPSALAWENLLKDPGFEEYQLSPKGFYTPTANAAWREITLGRASVQFNANSWTAPPEMLREGRLGFTPGTTGFKGMGPEQNKGRMIMEQDIVDPVLATHAGQLYEAWIWLGGAGRDNDKDPDQQEEVGGWDVFFYNNTDTAGWKESTAIEHHGISKDFFGEPGSFVRVAGFGKIPAGTKGARLRVWAATWASAAEPAGYSTEVAIDNARLAVIKAPNMLMNGDFELDVREGEMKGWQCPSDWPFGRRGMRPRDINNTGGENFDHGTYRPFYGAGWSYGYSTYLDGWGKKGFTFSQYADYRLPAGTPLTLRFNWIQNVKTGQADQLRWAGTEIEIAVEYLKGKERVGADGFHVDWPTPVGPGSVGRYDQNADAPYSPLFLLDPPAGTDRVGVNVNFMVNMPYRDGYRHVDAAIDDFLLVPLDLPASAASLPAAP